MTEGRRPNTIDFIEFPSPSVDALRRTKRLLSSVFGWSFEHWGEDYVDVSGSGLQSGINADAAHRPEQPLAVVYSNDLDRARERVLQAGGEIVRDTFSFPGGRRFHFREPSGNVLAVWSDDGAERRSQPAT
jgi:predicted enzyme related to lactoylglutathione lyase